MTALLMGDVRLHEGKLEMKTRLIGLPAGNTVWQEDHEGDVHQGASLQKIIVQAVIDAILPPPLPPGCCSAWPPARVCFSGGRSNTRVPTGPFGCCWDW